MLNPPRMGPGMMPPRGPPSLGGPRGPMGPGMRPNGGVSFEFNFHRQFVMDLCRE